MPNFLTLSAPAHAEIDPIKKSRFVGDAAPVANEDAAKRFIDEIRGERPSATHHCWAWRLELGDRGWRVSDDGEPGGTAGMPILARIDSAGLCGLVVVVTRTFGGTKLGRGGLIRAYGAAAHAVLAAAEHLEVHQTEACIVDLAYPDQPLVESVLRAHALSPTSVEFTERVQMALAVPIELIEVVSDALRDRTAGRVVLRSSST